MKMLAAWIDGIFDRLFGELFFVDMKGGDEDI